MFSSIMIMKHLHGDVLISKIPLTQWVSPELQVHSLCAFISISAKIFSFRIEDSFSFLRPVDKNPEFDEDAWPNEMFIDMKCTIKVRYHQPANNHEPFKYARNGNLKLARTFFFWLLLKRSSGATHYWMGHIFKVLFSSL